MEIYYQDFLIRSWNPPDREIAAQLIRSVLAEYRLQWEPEGADQDVLRVEDCYNAAGGEFWVVELRQQIVGTAAYYPIQRGEKAAEIRKMYLAPMVRGQGLGKFLLRQLEFTIATQDFQQIWIETVSILKEAIRLYESSGYRLAQGVETKRCDRVYVKNLSKHKAREQALSNYSV